MLVTEKVQIRLNHKNSDHFKELGYNINNKYIDVDVKHLLKGSHVKVIIKCDVCGAEKEQFYVAYNKFISRNKDNKYYCGKCNQINRKNTNIERYGDDSPIKIKKFKDKRIKTNIEKYGVDHPCKNEEVKNKIFYTNLERYGYKYPVQNKEIKDKIIKTNQEKYGGNSNFSSKEERLKFENIMLEKYGHKFSFQIESIKNCIIKRGLLTRINKIKKKYPNIIDIFGKNYTVKCDAGEDHLFFIDSHNFYQRLKYKTVICTICNPIDKHVSGTEIDFINFIQNVYNDKIIRNYRILEGKEIDIFLPKLNIGFEFNGLYWHSDEYKNISYHYDKIEISKKNNIRLFHVYDDDWKYKKNIIKKDIKRIIYQNRYDFDSIIEIKEEDASEYNNNNNLFGHIQSDINIVSIKNNSIVSLMSMKKENNTYKIERLTGDDNFDDLLGYAVQKYNPQIITGYLNRDWDVYNFYERNNFEIEKETGPEFNYIIENKKVRNDIKNIFFEASVPKIYNSGKIFYKLYLE